MYFQIIANVFVQTIILLYLIDNNTDTSWMILLGSGMGVVIEAWKASHVIRPIYPAYTDPTGQITKAVDIRIVASPAGSVLPYMLSIKGMTSNTFLMLRMLEIIWSDKHVLSEDEKRTQE